MALSSWNFLVGYIKTHTAQDSDIGYDNTYKGMERLVQAIRTWLVVFVPAARPR